MKNKITLKKSKKTANAKKCAVPFVTKKPDGKYTLSSFGRVAVICLSVIVVLIAALIISINSLISYYYNLMEYTDISKETVMGDAEISDYLASLETEDPTVTNSHNKEEISQQVGGAVSDVENIKENISGIQNILLLGVDNSGSVGSGNTVHSYTKNTDSMIVVTINEKTKRIVLTSIMRDSYVEIVKPNGSIVNGRVNTAYLYGGYTGLFNTIERNFAIEVDRFVQVDFSSFMDIVNIVGGVDMYVTREEAIEMNNVLEGINEIMGHSINADKLESTAAGTKHLNGKQALSYARIRHVTGSDFGRTERQRKLIMEIAAEAKTLSVTQLNNLLTSVLKKVSTNLTQSEVTSLMANAVSYLGYEIKSFRIPADKTFRDIVVEKKQMLWVDFVENYKLWKDLVTGDQ